MIDSIKVRLRRLKWDISYYLSYMRYDWIKILIFIIIGVIIGIIISLNTKICRISIINRIVIGEYKTFSTFIKANLYIILTLTLISFSGFFKLYRFAHYLFIFFWSFRLGVEIIIISNGFMGILSLIIIYIPYYILAISILSFHIVYIRIVVPSPRLNWWCYSKQLMMELIRRSLILMVPTIMINTIIFIINPIIIQIFAIVL